MAKAKVNKQKNNKKQYIFAVGRRKEAVARVRLYQPSNGAVDIFGQQYQKGDVVINGKPYGVYFSYLAYKPYFKKFFDATSTLDKFLFSVKVEGGGKRGQIGAVLMGMARTLDKYNRDEYRSILKKHGYLTSDARVRERRKVGMGGKARRKRQSPKR